MYFFVNYEYLFVRLYNYTCFINILEDDSINSELTSVKTGKLNNTDEATDTLLKNGLPSRQQRYATSEFSQFWVVLKRTLLFSRRDWVSFYET